MSHWRVHPGGWFGFRAHLEAEIAVATRPKQRFAGEIPFWEDFYWLFLCILKMTSRAARTLKLARKCDMDRKVMLSNIRDRVFGTNEKFVYLKTPVLDKSQQILDFQNWTFKSYFLLKKAGFTLWWQQFSSRESTFPEISSNFLSPFSLVNLVKNKSNLVCA